MFFLEMLKNVANKEKTGKAGAQIKKGNTKIKKQNGREVENH